MTQGEYDLVKEELIPQVLVLIRKVESLKLDMRRQNTLASTLATILSDIMKKD